MTFLPMSPGVESDVFVPDPAQMLASAPKILWIELTSKCPFDCTFCSRKVRFGAGRHMEWAIFESVLRDLDHPEFIGLNYSGESLTYPRLIEAIECAASTGAATEIVTAFPPISSKLLRAIVDSPLDRLAVSLHTMDAAQYDRVYQFGSLASLKHTLGELLAYRHARGSSTPRLDLCFVALSETLEQLPHVAAYAGQLGVTEIFIHPLIGRHLVSGPFSRELEGEALRSDYKQALREVVADVRRQHPHLGLTILNADIEPSPHLTHVPLYFGPPLPPGARIHSCVQNPWETAHILANGDVVVCEVHDEVALGNLHDASLREIWHGEAYRRFRDRYRDAEIPECRSCPWKKAYLPEPRKSAISASDGMSAQLLRGWHEADDGDIVWSKREAMAVLPHSDEARSLRVRGILLQAPDGDPNVLTITGNGQPLGEVVNRSAGSYTFDLRFALPERVGPELHLSFLTRRTVRPSHVGTGHDTRDLGFALARLEIVSRRRWLP